MSLNWSEEDLARHNERRKKGAKSAHKPPAKNKLQALGRLKPGQMNKTEQRFCEEWIAPRMLAGEITWWAFEAITLKLAQDCRLTIDFFVMLSNGELQAIDVKGNAAVVMDDALVKLRVASEKFPWPVAMAMPVSKKDGGGWDIKWIK